MIELARHWYENWEASTKNVSARCWLEFKKTDRHRLASRGVDGTYDGSRNGGFFCFITNLNTKTKHSSSAKAASSCPRLSNDHSRSAGMLLTHTPRPRTFRDITVAMSTLKHIPHQFTNPLLRSRHIQNTP